MIAQVMKFTHGTVIFMHGKNEFSDLFIYLLLFRDWFCKNLRLSTENLLHFCKLGNSFKQVDFYTYFDSQTLKIKILLVSPITFCISDFGSSERWIGWGRID